MVTEWPNQFIRITHHAGAFLNDPYGIGARQPYGSEALESANSWLKNYNRHFTFRGDRKRAIKTVFKLQKFFPVVAVGTKKGTGCGVAGHQKNSQQCISKITMDLDNDYDSE